MSKYVYLLVNEVGRYKIGISSDVEKRCKTLSYSGGVTIEMICKLWTPYASTFEEFLHTMYYRQHYSGEWFNFKVSPQNEITALHQEFILVYNSICKGFDNEMQGFAIARNLQHLLPNGAISHKRVMRINEAKK